MHSTIDKGSESLENKLISYRIRGHTAPNNLNGVVATTIVKDDAAFTVFTDLPERMGGHNSAPQPMEWLVVAFVGCTQATAHFVARHYWRSEKIKLITLQRLEFQDITATRDSRGSTALPIVDAGPHGEDGDTDPPSRIQQLTGTIRVYFKTPSEDDVQERAECLRVLQAQTERRCPVANTIAASGCRMDVVWEDAGPLPAPKFDWE
jgi:uncharacterized OsmC-like protein